MTFPRAKKDTDFFFEKPLNSSRAKMIFRHASRQRLSYESASFSIHSAGKKVHFLFDIEPSFPPVVLH